MNRLRHSRFAKTVFMFTAAAMTAVCVFNIGVSVIFVAENLVYADKKQLQQKVYTGLYNYTEKDLFSYLNRVEDNLTDYTYSNYNMSEIELFRRKYSGDKSNIRFVIRDDAGNTLLSNHATDCTGDCFTGSSRFVFGNSDPIERSKIENYNFFPYKSSFHHTKQTPDTEALTNPHGETSPAEPATANNDNNDKNPSADKNTEQKAEKGYKSVTKLLTKLENSQTKLTYYYSGEIDPMILQICKSFAEGLPFALSEIIMYQDEYAYDSKNDILIPVQKPEDGGKTKSFSTLFVLGNNSKQVKLNYTYMGSLRFNQFSDRLRLAACAALADDRSIVEIAYTQTDEHAYIGCTLEISVPYECDKDDIYKLAESFVNFLLFYRSRFAVIAGISTVLLIISLFFVFWSAGFVPKYEKAQARGLHAVPFDLTIVLAAVLLVPLVSLSVYGHSLLSVLGLLFAGFILLYLAYTLVVRLRAGTFRSNNLSVKLYRLLSETVSALSLSGKIALVSVIICVTFAFVTVFEVLFILNVSSELIFALLIILRLVEFPFLVIFLASLAVLHTGAEKISKGDLNYHVSSPLLVSGLKKHAEYLNNIQSAVTKAAEEKIKSESLKTELITNVSHDLKTPLTSVVNYVDLLKKEDIQNETAKEYIDIIDRQSQRLKKLTFDVIEASKAATGNIEAHFERTVLNVVLLQTNGEYIDKLNENSLTLVQDIPEKDIVVSTDGRLLWRIIDNLMNNICKYSLPGTRVYLSLAQKNGYADIVFKNISKNELNVEPSDLTQRFVKGDTSASGGSGLGLSIAKSLSDIIGAGFAVDIDGDLFKATLHMPVCGA